MKADFIRFDPQSGRTPFQRVPACGGFALLFALIALVLVSLAATVAVNNYRLEAQRERELDLLFVGEQIRAAIAHYNLARVTNPGGEYPKSLDDLLLDTRQIVTVRHLRRLYADPMTGQADWELEKIGGRIVGVHSRAAGVPLIRAGFTEAQQGFGAARSYADWHFSLAAGGASSGINSESAPTPPGNGANGPDNPDSKGAPANPVTSAIPPDVVQSRQCFENYQVPQGDCGEEPPPYGKDQTECLLHFQQLYNSCMAGMPGQ